MNYYEELGVAPTASTEEIRHAYKALARMLHPDQFPEEGFKNLADLQMKRLNQMLAVLTNPEERLRYNFRLNTPTAPPARHPMEPMPAVRPRTWSRPFAIGFYAWLPPVVVFLLFMGAMIFYGSAAGRGSVPNRSADEESSDRVAPAETTPLVAATVNGQAAAGFDKERLEAALRGAEHDLSVLRAEHQKTLDQLARLNQLPSVEEVPQESAAVKPLVPATPKAAPAEVRPASTPVHTENTPFLGSTPPSAKLSGHWYYVPDSHLTPAKGIYMPEYIELRLTEDGGTLRGRYHARYRITDQAISPEVIFQFEGTGVPPVTQIPWTGAGDARGTVAFRLISPDQLEVSWTATRLSSDLNLASGTAQLIRQRESR